MNGITCCSLFTVENSLQNKILYKEEHETGGSNALEWEILKD